MRHRFMTCSCAAILLASASALPTDTDGRPFVAQGAVAGASDQSIRVRHVSGSGVHLFATAIVHSKEFTKTGLTQRSTETVELTGDLVGRVLYHPTSVFDFVKGTLVNTGHQVFSGTVLGSAPLMIHDDEFRFEVNLSTGATAGEVHLTNRLAGPKLRCHLSVVGTGMTTDGNSTFDYTGECVLPK